MYNIYVCFWVRKGESFVHGNFRFSGGTSVQIYGSGHNISTTKAYNLTSGYWILEIWRAPYIIKWNEGFTPPYGSLTTLQDESNFILSLYKTMKIFKYNVISSYLTSHVLLHRSPFQNLAIFPYVRVWNDVLYTWSTLLYYTELLSLACENFVNFPHMSHILHSAKKSSPPESPTWWVWVINIYCTSIIAVYILKRCFMYVIDVYYCMHKCTVCNICVWVHLTIVRTKLLCFWVMSRRWG